MGCLRCGVCCSRHQAIASHEETRRVISFLKITIGEWEKMYADPRWPGEDNYLIRHRNGACIFLRRDKNVCSCDIQPVKPACCTDWLPGLDKKECRAGLMKRWESALNQQSAAGGLVIAAAR